MIDGPIESVLTVTGSSLDAFASTHMSIGIGDKEGYTY